ncbi:uncharacterized protein DS421_7g215450 [Arachis hypogaea]|nr:uncharacterized protein DS421_7g215450 [Arachis hypogaea]
MVGMATGQGRARDASLLPLPAPQIRSSFPPSIPAIRKYCPLFPFSMDLHFLQAPFSKPKVKWKERRRIKGGTTGSCDNDALNDRQRLLFIRRKRTTNSEAELRTVERGTDAVTQR